jgi:hypothetical protein
MTNPVDQAEGIKADEAVSARDGESGVTPGLLMAYALHRRGKRKRGFFRALNRKEPWAVYEANHAKWMKEATDKLTKLLYEPNPFFGLLNRDNEPIPVMSGLSAWLPKNDGK